MTTEHVIMSVDELQTLTEMLSLKWFRKPFRHSVMYNNRLRTTGGRYMLGDHSIQMNPIVEVLYGREEVIGVLKHELCHYHLHIEGRGYKHGDLEFKDLLNSTQSPRFCKPLYKHNKTSARIRVYTCVQCELMYERKRRVDTNRFRCGKCHGKLREVQST